MDAIGVCHFGLRNLGKSMAGQAHAIIRGSGDYPRGHSFLLLLAQAQRNLFGFGRGDKIRAFAGWKSILSESMAIPEVKWSGPA